MVLDWTTVVNDFGVLITFFGVLFGLKKKWPALFVFATFIENHAGQIVKEVETVGEAILKTPAGAIAAHSLHAEVDRVTDSFKHSEIARLALVGLHSFNSLSKDLSDTQRVALEQFVINSIPKDWGIDSKDIQLVLTDVEQAVAEFSKLGLVQAANTFTEAQKASTIASVTTGDITV